MIKQIFKVINPQITWTKDENRAPRYPPNMHVNTTFFTIIE